jgi:hypothetical protein
VLHGQEIRYWDLRGFHQASNLLKAKHQHADVRVNMHPYYFTGQQQPARSARSSYEGDHAYAGQPNNNELLCRASTAADVPLRNAWSGMPSGQPRDDYLYRQAHLPASSLASSGMAGATPFMGASYSSPWASEQPSTLEQFMRMRQPQQFAASQAPAYESRFAASQSPSYSTSNAARQQQSHLAAYERGSTSASQLAAIQALQQALLGRPDARRSSPSQEAFDMAGMHATNMMPPTRPAWSGAHEQPPGPHGISGFTSLERAACDMWAFVANSSVAGIPNKYGTAKVPAQHYDHHCASSPAGVRSPSVCSPLSSLTARDKELLLEIVAKASSLNSDCGAEATSALESAQGGASLTSAASTVVQAALEHDQDSHDSSISSSGGLKRKRADSDPFACKRPATTSPLLEALLINKALPGDKDRPNSLRSDISSVSLDEGEDEGLSLGPGLPRD